ncbi:hypothetical protein LCGC14_2002740 [marine sediment metagenome]|uniref:Uncharacterized protein n=1 Tax=marine sediment metagenome TaxID=412755 RepID=A0A0F9HZS1_9ZZZZ
MANNIPTWEEWQNLDNDVQEYERHRILLSLDNRLTSLESAKWKNGVLTIGGAFLGGAAAVGTGFLAKMVFWK